jgi:antitoxin VapB
MVTAKVFKSGNSQAVRLPKEYRLDVKEVSVNRIGNVLMMVPKGDPWHVFSEGLKEIGNDFPSLIGKIKHSARVPFK